MATSKTIAADIDIVNLALVKLGFETLSDFDDETNVKAANIATASFDNILKVVMSQYPWDFATQFFTITAGTLPSASFNPANDSYDWTGAFDLPGGYLKAHSVKGQSSIPGDDWVQRGSQILTNLGDENGQIQAEIIMYISNVGIYTPAFIDAVAERCAREWAPTLLRVSSENTRLEATSKDKLRDAASSDGSVGSPRRVESNASSVYKRR